MVHCLAPCTWRPWLGGHGRFFYVVLLMPTWVGCEADLALCPIVSELPPGSGQQSGLSIWPGPCLSQVAGELWLLSGFGVL